MGCATSSIIVLPEAKIVKKGPKDSIEKHYKINSEPIAIGSYGSVFEATNLTDSQTVVVKSISKEANICQIPQLRDEIRILRELDHPNIIRFQQVFESTEHIHLVTEKCEGGQIVHERTDENLTLEDQRVEPMKEEYVAEIMEQVFKAIAYCHYKGVMHRDIKPQNILFKSAKNN
jgi:calcium-dependent protein kinase